MSGFQEFTELKVFQLAEAFSDSVWQIAIKWELFARNTFNSFNYFNFFNFFNSCP